MGGRFKPVNKKSDIFIQTLKILPKRGLPVHAFLTGPSRGYVKEQLIKNNIPFFHSHVSHIDELILFYCFDLYLITSREEGGPMGLLESGTWNTNSYAKVGMAEDVIPLNIPGEVSDEFDPTFLANKVETL